MTAKPSATDAPRCGASARADEIHLERDYTPEEISEAWNDERETRENARFWAEESSMGW